MIRQKNGADTFYTLHTSRSSGDLLLTNEELPRVASRRREVTDSSTYRLGVNATALQLPACRIIGFSLRRKTVATSLQLPATAPRDKAGSDLGVAPRAAFS